MKRPVESAVTLESCVGPRCEVCGHPVEVVPGDVICENCNHSWFAVMPQEGPQELFLSMRWVDIIVYGGAAGGGKTWALLLDPIAHIDVPTFGAVYFRRHITEVTNEGGLWDESEKLYPHLLGKPVKSPSHKWEFPGGQTISFRHLQHERTKYQHQGGQYPWLGFDELTHFEESQFWYLVSRNRPKDPQTLRKYGVHPRVRCSTNPDAGSWVKKFIAPWVDKTHPDPAKSGEVRWLVRKDPDYFYFRTREEAESCAREKLKIPEKLLPHAIKSVSFIEADVFDNHVLMENNPSYLANLLAQNEVEQQRLLYKNWDILADRFFEEWMPTRADGSHWHVIPTREIPRGCYYYLATDWGYKDPFASYLIAVQPDKRKIVCREIYGRRIKTGVQGKMMAALVKANGLEVRRVSMYAGRDAFSRRLIQSTGEYDDPIATTWEELGFNCIPAGGDPLARADKTREHLTDWGPDEGWPSGRPGLQVMDCCVNLIRTLPLLKSDEKRPEVVDTTQEDHAYDAVGMLLDSKPAIPDAPQFREDIDIRARDLAEDDQRRRTPKQKGFGQDDYDM